MIIDKIFTHNTLKKTVLPAAFLLMASVPAIGSTPVKYGSGTDEVIINGKVYTLDNTATGTKRYASWSTATMEPASGIDMEAIEKRIAELRKKLNSARTPDDVSSVLSRSLRNAKCSAEVVLIQITALEKGIDLRDKATEIDQTVFQQYGDDSYWESVVENEERHGGFSRDIASHPVRGAEFDDDTRSIYERVLAAKDEASLPLVQEFLETSFRDNVLEATENDESQALDITSVAGLDLTKLENLTTENSNKEISDRGEQLGKAAAEVEGGITVLNEKIDASLKNIADQNTRIAQQIQSATQHVNIIRDYIGEPNQAALRRYKENIRVLQKLDFDNYNEYDEADRYDVEMHDRDLIGRYVDRRGILVSGQDGQFTWAFDDIKDEAQRYQYERALQRLMTIIPDIQEQINAIGAAKTDIKTCRQNAVGSLRDVEMCRVMVEQLTKMMNTLTSKSIQLTDMAQILASIDDFYESSETRETSLYESEVNNTQTATDRAQSKVGSANQHLEESGSAINDDPTKTTTDDDDAGRNRDAGRSVARGTRRATQASPRITRQNDAQSFVSEYNREKALRENYARPIYNPHQEPELVNGKVPPQLRRLYRTCILKIGNNNDVSYVLKAGGDAIQLKKDGHVFFTITSQTTEADIRYMQVP